MEEKNTAYRELEKEGITALVRALKADAKLLAIAEANGDSGRHDDRLRVAQVKGRLMMSELKLLDGVNTLRKKLLGLPLYQ